AQVRARLGDPVVLILIGMMAAWSALFISLGWIRHARYSTFGFDLGIYDQGIWLLSRFKDPFVTIRGLDLFGHHTNPILLLLVPFYWLGAGPIFLLIVQVLAQASGAVAVFLLARDRLADRWLALVLAGALLLNPTMQWLTWEFFHPDSLAIAPLLFAYWAATRKRWGWFAVAGVLALACKEDAALALFAMGLVIALRGDRRIGAVTSFLAVAWFTLASRVLIPFFSGGETFYESFFGEFGKTPLEVAGNVLRHPTKAYETATEPDRMSYYRMMLAPMAFLPLAAARTFLIAVPMVGVNVLSTFPYQREIRYHYQAVVLVGLTLATVEGIAILGRTIGMRRFLVGLVAATSLATTVAWGPSPVSVKYKSGIWPLGEDSRRATKQEALALIPSGAPTSAIYYLAPHLTHRAKIYEFPVPWKPANWGVRGENLHDPADVEWLVLDRGPLSEEDKALLESLLDTQFQVRFERDDIVVAERIKVP
ncbi:MAG: hypothetical protein QOG87_3183, partial [Actinomycetota bacterium]